MNEQEFKYWRGCGEIETLYIAGGKNESSATMENSPAVSLKKLKGGITI